jgi:hypothetical protein
MYTALSSVRVLKQRRFRIESGPTQNWTEPCSRLILLIQRRRGWNPGYVMKIAHLYFFEILTIYFHLTVINLSLVQVNIK